MDILDDSSEDSLDEAYAIIAEMRLQLLMMDREMTQVKEENRALKAHLQTLCMNESAKSETSEKKQLAREKWAFYRQMKDEVRISYKLTDWRAIKRITDELFADKAAA